MSIDEATVDAKIERLRAATEGLLNILYTEIMEQPKVKFGSFELSSPKCTPGDLSGFHQVTFPQPFSSAAPVQVLANVTSCNGVDTPGLRIADVSPTGFKVRMDELVGNGKRLTDGAHGKETICWVAFQGPPEGVARSGYGVMALTMK